MTLGSSHMLYAEFLPTDESPESEPLRECLLDLDADRERAMFRMPICCRVRSLSSTVMGRVRDDVRVPGAGVAALRWFISLRVFDCNSRASSRLTWRPRSDCRTTSAALLSIASFFSEDFLLSGLTDWLRTLSSDSVS